MKEKDMMDKLRNEPARMDAAEEAWLDERLASPAQLQISEMVQALPEDEPALAWRSELSAKIHAVAASRERKRRFNWTLRPALGIGAAAVLAVTFMIKSETGTVGSGIEAPPPSLEQQILSAHMEATQSNQVWGALRAIEEARPVSAPAAEEYRWDDLDLGTL